MRSSMSHKKSVNAQAGSRTDHSRQSSGILQSVNSTKVLFRYVVQVFFPFFSFSLNLCRYQYCVAFLNACYGLSVMSLLFFLVCRVNYSSSSSSVFLKIIRKKCRRCCCYFRFQTTVEYSK